MTCGYAQSKTDVSGGQSERTEEHQYVKKSLPSRKGLDVNRQLFKTAGTSNVEQTNQVRT